MEHFYKSIHGWCDFEPLYDEVVNNAQDGAHFVELGTWHGSSAAYMAVNIANSGKQIRFDAVDTWAGDENEPTHKLDEYVVAGTLYEKFLTNIEPVKDYINPKRMTTLKAAEQYAPNSLDFVFVDAGHDYHSALSDIMAYLPKMKSGGILAGHDYRTLPDTVALAVEHALTMTDRVDDWSVVCHNCWLFRIK